MATHSPCHSYTPFQSNPDLLCTVLCTCVAWQLKPEGEELIQALRNQEPEITRGFSDPLQLHIAVQTRL